jgi:hypothetical protein
MQRTSETAMTRAVPYIVGLAIAVGLFVHLGTIDYTPRPGTLGPETWPRAAVVLMAAACLFEIVRIALGRAVAAEDAGEIEAEGETAGEQRYPLLLIGGILLVALYAVLLGVLGFPITTFLFLAAFIYLGRYRRHGAIWAFSLLMTLFMCVLFLRVAYVSLPRGTAPFDRVSDLFLLIPSL